MVPEGLQQQIQEQLGGVRQVDLLVGLPTFNNAATAAQVVRTMVAGVRRVLPHASVLLLNLDAGSQDGTPDIVRQAVGATMPTVLLGNVGVSTLLNSFAAPTLSESGMPGREQAFRALFASAELLQPKATLLMEADLQSMAEDWSGLLLAPLLEKQADFVAPLYRRPRYEGSLTNNLIYPLNRALYGRRLHCHTGGAYGFSTKLIQGYLRDAVWEQRTSPFGIETWLATVPLAEGYEVYEAFLGDKVQAGASRQAALPLALAQAVGTVFQLMERYQDVWEGRTGSSPIPVVGPQYAPGEGTVSINVERMINGFRQGLRDLLPVWEIILAPETLAAILPLGLAEVEEFRMPPTLWVQIVLDFALAFHEKVLHREHVLKSLTPLYLARTASQVLETSGGGVEALERSIETLCEAFERMKPYLIQRWRFP